jgi:predicted flap endonuclease-1-like 5' DNA nuclease
MRQPPRLIRDSADRYKLKISLPGGRYQLSLDDRAVIVLIDELGLTVRDTVPEPFIPFFVAMGDAWFPRQRDVDAVLEDLQIDGRLDSDEYSVLHSYVTETRVPERNADRVRRVLEQSPLADELDSEALQIQSLPSIPDILEGSETTESGAKSAGGKTDSGSSMEKRQTGTKQQQPPPGQQTEQEAVDDIALETLQEIPGIGPHRAEQLVDGGVKSLAALAEARPVDLASLIGISEDIAAVAVEGAREVLGQTPPASERLRKQTGVETGVFEPALSSLAASGVPASEAIPQLRVLYGPTVADIESVSGQQAYYLWEAGYQTPHDILEASIEELTSVYQVGSTTAPDIQDGARELLHGD